MRHIRFFDLYSTTGGHMFYAGLHLPAVINSKAQQKTSANQRDLVAATIFLKNKSVPKMARYPQKIISFADHAHKCNCKVRSPLVKKPFYISVQKPQFWLIIICFWAT